MARALFCLMALQLAVGVASADDRVEVRGVAPTPQGLKVIEEKCLVCHNRQRIDAAIKSRRDMERILVRMEKKGVSLTAQEREVMAHYWKKSPFRSGAKRSVPP